jgi:hypothetical protein
MEESPDPSLTKINSTERLLFAGSWSIKGFGLLDQPRLHVILLSKIAYSFIDNETI